MGRVFAGRFLGAGLLVLGLLGMAIGGEDGRDAPDEPVPASTDILDTLARTEKFKSLAKAVEAAGLEAKFRELGPFTFFAPTDEAFAKLPQDTLDALLKDKARITAILMGHLVPGKLSADELVKQKTAKTLSEVTLVVTPPAEDMPLKIENASIVTKDIATTNGVVHTIDTVLMPK